MFGFIISSYCTTDTHLRQLHRCIDSVEKFHPENPIIVIDDFSTVANLTNEFCKHSNITVVKSINKGSADMQPFYFLCKFKHLFNRAVIIQDSMMLLRRLTDIEKIDKVQFLWGFTNHRFHWDKITEPKTEYNITNNIVSHTDLINDRFAKKFEKYPDLVKFAQEKLNNKKWVGCFGCLCVITAETVEEFNKQIEFVDVLPTFTSNRDRRVGESVFSLICHYLLYEHNFENTYDGIYYDGITPNKYHSKPYGYDNLEICCKMNHFIKVSFRR